MSGGGPRGLGIVLIAALDRRSAIGRAGALPWHLPADLKRFKALTLGNPILMGRKTAQAIGRALPGRLNLVLTRSEWTPFAGMQLVASLDDAFAHAGVAESRELCVIGGGEIYTLTLPLATRMHLTYVDTTVAGADAFFPGFDACEWRETARQRHSADANHAFAFDFADYERR